MVLKNERGQSLIEYVILVALVGVATMGMVRLLQKNIKVNLANVIESLAPESRHNRAHFEHVKAVHLNKADFSNFMSGAVGAGHDGE